MRRVRMAGVGLLVASMALGATAGGDTAPQLAAQAEKLSTEGKVREAADALRRAYELDPSPKLLFALARASERAGDLVVAFELYGRYLASPQADAALAHKASQVMDRLRPLVAKEEAARKAAEAEQKRVEDERRAAEAKARTESEAARAQQQAREAEQQAAAETRAREHDRPRLIAKVCAGTAVAGVGMSLVFALNALSSKNAFTTAPDVASKRRQETATQRQAVLADVGAGVAIAAAAGAAYAWRQSRDAPEKPVAVTVSVAPLGAGVSVSF